MENKKESGFSYTYSAKEKDEILKIRQKYTDREEDKMERLRRLDAQVSKKAQVVSLTLGMVGVIMLGFGMSLFMSDLGTTMGLKDTVALAVGVAIGIPGGIIAGVAYPVYNRILKIQRKKIAPEILKLTDELMK